VRAQDRKFGEIPGPGWSVGAAWRGPAGLAAQGGVGSGERKRAAVSGWSAQARERERELGWAQLLGSWAGLVWGLGLFSIFLSLFYFYFKQTLNSNTNLNSNNTQIKTCTSMNATQKLNLDKF
jgi:hypothetical protein